MFQNCNKKLSNFLPILSSFKTILQWSFTLVTLNIRIGFRSWGFWTLQPFHPNSPDRLGMTRPRARTDILFKLIEK